MEELLEPRSPFLLAALLCQDIAPQLCFQLVNTRPALCMGSWLPGFHTEQLCTPSSTGHLASDMPGGLVH